METRTRLINTDTLTSKRGRTVGRALGQSGKTGFSVMPVPPGRG
jgi:hypothetical protein